MCSLVAYIMLGERVHTVWCPTFTTPRYKSPLYILSMVLILAYLTVVCHLFVGTSRRSSLILDIPCGSCSFAKVRIATLRRSRMCLIGLELNGVILLLIFDMYVPLFVPRSVQSVNIYIPYTAYTAS